jgi:hypothetical protein
VIERQAHPAGIIAGRAALREYFRRGLETDWARPRFVLLDALPAIGGYMLYYARDGGLTVMEAVGLDADERAIDVRVSVRRSSQGSSAESRAQFEARLLRVIARARLEAHEGAFAFEPVFAGAALRPDALACVRDGATWTQLVPMTAREVPATAYRMFSFHFDASISAQGFVAWLASHINTSVGTGVIIVCGKDARGGDALYRASQGVFDYWGCPYRLGDAVLEELERLRERGRALN